MSVRRRFVASGLLVAGLAACASPGYDEPRLQRELERAGVAPDAAGCVADALPDSVDIRELALEQDPNADQLESTRAVLERCGVSLPPR